MDNGPRKGPCYLAVPDGIRSLMSKGLLIAFEGVDKAGKGTQSRILAERLKGTRIAFPRYDTPVGKVIKRHLMGEVAMAYEHCVDSSFPERDGELVYRVDESDPMAFQGLMLMDKAHATTEIMTLVDKGQHVVLDRWVDSALAYGGADGLDRGLMETIHAVLPRADVTVFLDIDPEVSCERGRAPGDDRTKDDRYERDLPRLKKVYENYRNLFDFNTPTRHHLRRTVVNGSFPVEMVSELVWLLGGFTG